MILVSGATGNVGRHVVDQLLSHGTEVRALTRDPAASGLPSAAEPVTGDLTRPETVAHAFRDVDVLFLFPVPGTAGPILRVARDHGVRKVVLLSSAAVEYRTPGADNAIVAAHRDLEHDVASSGLEWTLLRPCGFAANTRQWAPQIRADGVVRGPYAGAEMALVHERDIADAATRVLLTDGHEGAAYVLTGPESLTQAEQARRIGEAIGRPVRYEELPLAAARAQMIADGVPPSFADMSLTFQAELVGVPAAISADIEMLTGHAARGFGRWAAEHAADFR